MWRRVICKLIGHRHELFADGYKRRCKRCGDEDWLMSNPYPKIGQPKYFWQSMPFNRLKF